MEGPELIVLGDSYALGWGVEQEESFPALLEASTGLNVLNAAMSSYANVLGADAAGIEYDKQMVKISRRAGKALKDLVDAKRFRIVRGDFFKYSWSGYGVIFFFDLSSFEPERVREKLRQEMDPGAILIVGYEQAPFPGFELVERDRPNHPSITVYRQPSEAAVSGR